MTAGRLCRADGDQMPERAPEAIAESEETLRIDPENEPGAGTDAIVTLVSEEQRVVAPWGTQRVTHRRAACPTP